MQRCGWWIGVIILGIGAVAPVVSRAQSSALAGGSKIEDRGSNIANSDPQSSILYPQSSTLDSQPSVTTITPDLLQHNIPLLGVVPDEPASIYAPIEPERPIDGTNKGGVNVDLNFRYLTDDVYRGISHNFAVYNDRVATGAPRHASNFETDVKLSFNLGKLPHPFVAVFSNINDSDPASRFQEIRPSAGVDYTIRPISVSAGVNDYIYPERDTLDNAFNQLQLSYKKNPGSPNQFSYKDSPVLDPNTSEIFVRVSLDDSYFFKTQKPYVNPYILGAYDYDKNKGWYLETGVKHDFDFPDFGLTLSPYGDVAYVSHFPQQFITDSENRITFNKLGQRSFQHQSSSGFQHYDLGLVGTVSLNHWLHLPPRYGQFAIEGYITYTSKFSNPVMANTEVWGGVGLKYRY